MTKKKIEIEVEYPDCEICGKCIEENEEYIELNIAGTKFICHRGEYTTTGISFKGKRTVICKRCATEDKDKSKQRLQGEVDDVLSGANWQTGEEEK